MTALSPARTREQRATTIFKRRPTRGYTTVTSDVINDPDLSLDELAALIKLLALPGTWQLHPFEIRKRWGVGREKYYRIMNRLIELRFVIAGEMMRDPDTQAFVGREFMVFDERQPDSAGPSAGPIGPDDDGAANDMDDEIPASGGGSEASATVASLPHTGLPHTADPHAARQHPEEKKDNNNNYPPNPPNQTAPPSDAERTASPQASAHDAPPGRIKTDGPLGPAAPPPVTMDRGPPSLGSRIDSAAGPAPSAPAARSAARTAEPAPTLETFLAKYPADKIMSDVRCQRVWLRLLDDDRRLALAGLPAFLADRAEHKIKLPDAATYLRDKLWRKFMPNPVGVAKEWTPLTPDMPNWHRWIEYFEASGRLFSVKFMRRHAAEGKPYVAEAPWPPTLPSPSSQEPAEEADGQARP
ncbi:MAG: hypothetical protein AB7U62_04420 [Pseudolabrys sp.]